LSGKVGESLQHQSSSKSNFKNSSSFSNNNNNHTNKNSRMITSASFSHANIINKKKTMTISESPKPLQVPFNSPHDIHHQQTSVKTKSSHLKNGKNSNSAGNSSERLMNSLSLETVSPLKDKNTDTLLLNLIKNKENTPASKNINLLDIINKKSPVVPTKTTSTTTITTSRSNQSGEGLSKAVNSLFESKPKLITAQELETMQLSQQKMKRSATTANPLTPMATLTTTTTTTTTMLTNQNVLATTTTSSSKNNSNDLKMKLNDIIKQAGNVHKTNFVQNQTKTQSSESISDIIKKLHSSVAAPSSRVNEDSTNALKQLLNLNNSAATVDKKSTSGSGSGSGSGSKSSNQKHHRHHQKTKDENRNKENKSNAVLAGDDCANIEKALINNNNNKKQQLNSQKGSSSQRRKNQINKSNDSDLILQQIKGDNVVEKKSTRNEVDLSHFNQLLNKIMPQQQQHHNNNNNNSKSKQIKMTQSQSEHTRIGSSINSCENKVDILKWFQNDNKTKLGF
jgi:hypothetical protein